MTFDISWVSLWRIFAFLVFASILFLGKDILLALFLSVVISSGLEFLVNFFERRGIPRVLGVVIIFLLSALAVIFIVYTIIPLVIVELNTAFLSLHDAGNNAWWGSFFSPQATESFNAFLGEFSSKFFGQTASPFQAFAGFLGGIALAASVIVSAFYLSLSRDGVERFILAVFPRAHEENALAVYRRSIHRVGVWFRTQVLMSIIVGGLTLVGLLLLGVHSAVLLGIITAIFEVVPFIGPLIAGSLAVVVAAIQSPSLALYTMIVFLGIQQIENHFLVPIVVGRNVDLHPVIVIVALLIGFEAGGILGMVISVPAAVVIQEVIEDWAGRRRAAVMPQQETA